jgi:hypothetical protein
MNDNFAEKIRICITRMKSHTLHYSKTFTVQCCLQGRLTKFMPSLLLHAVQEKMRSLHTVVTWLLTEKGFWKSQSCPVWQCSSIIYQETEENHRNFPRGWMELRYDSNLVHHKQNYCIINTGGLKSNGMNSNILCTIHNW